MLTRGDMRVKYTYAHNFIECRVWADTELGSRYVVVNRCWNQYDRYAELRVLVPGLGQHQRAVVCLLTRSATYLEDNIALTLRSAKVIIMPHRTIWSWYTGRWWVGSYIWYSVERNGWSQSLPRTFLAVPNETTHPLTASVPITRIAV